MLKITLTQVKEKATDLAQTGFAKSSQVAEMTKLQLNIVSQEDIIKKSFFELGKRYYEQNSNNPEPAYEAACQRVEGAYKKIAQNKERIKELRNPDILSIYDINSDYIDVTEEDIFSDSVEDDSEV